MLPAKQSQMLTYVKIPLPAFLSASFQEFPTGCYEGYISVQVDVNLFIGFSLVSIAVDHAVSRSTGSRNPVSDSW